MEPNTEPINPRQKAVSEIELDLIEKDFFAGIAGDTEISRLIESVKIHRTVLSKLFAYFKPEPLRRVSTANPVVNSELAYLKELVAMENES